MQWKIGIQGTTSSRPRSPRGTTRVSDCVYFAPLKRGATEEDAAAQRRGKDAEALDIRRSIYQRARILITRHGANTVLFSSALK